MLSLNIPETELWDDGTNSFVYCKACTINLEHSLVSLSKWETKYCEPFIKKDQIAMDPEKYLDYIKCMTITQNVPDVVYKCITPEQFEEIKNYIESPHTATTFNDMQKKGSASSEGITSELIYYWMTSYQIPWEAQKWHLNRLLTLIKIFGVKNEPAKKMSKADMAKHYRAQNEARKAKLKTHG